MNQYKYDKIRLQRHMPQLRGCAGLSMEALAEKVGLTKQAISFMETHQDKPMTKMQYICIRAAFDEEYQKNPDNINLRDCYDLVFSDPKFYKENRDRLEYALYQAVEDTKTQKRRMKAEAKKRSEEALIASSVVTGASEVLTDVIKTATNAISESETQKSTVTMAGATSATLAIGGIAAATFPFMFSFALAAGGTKALIKAKKKNPKNKERDNRVSWNTKHPQWMMDAFDAKESEEKGSNDNES